MAQPELADALLNTDFILFFVMVTKPDMVEFSTLGTFSRVARVVTRRMARPKVVGEMVSKKTADGSRSFLHCGRKVFQLLPKST